MNNVASQAPSTLPSRHVQPSHPQVYRAPHKALRYELSFLLVRMGAADFTEPLERDNVIDELESVLAFCDAHIEHEDAFLRPALLARSAAPVTTLDEEHAEHATQVAELRSLARTLRESDLPAAQRSLGQTLYLHYSVFVAETLAHMAYEERVVQPLLERLFTPKELLDIHDAILASIPPPEMMRALRSFIPSSNREERAEILGGARASMPEDAFAGLLGQMCALLSFDDAADLRRRLGL
ncbi:MAG: hemerythrin domain-containing protein [Labilithrix sp.]|nr:hemerythrin domain-containing protein [Labilithrix sp.]MCW5810376.1 hemerythrin domain-containing protein [Labilithrix sp.]